MEEINAPVKVSGNPNLIAMLAVILLISGGIYFYKDKAATEERRTLTEKIAMLENEISEMKQAKESEEADASLSAAEADAGSGIETETAGWQIYSNGRYGYSIKYPASWFSCGRKAPKKIFLSGEESKSA